MNPNYYLYINININMDALIERYRQNTTPNIVYFILGNDPDAIAIDANVAKLWKTVADYIDDCKINVMPIKTDLPYITRANIDLLADFTQLYIKNGGIMVKSPHEQVNEEKYLERAPYEYDFFQSLTESTISDVTLLAEYMHFADAVTSFALQMAGDLLNTDPGEIARKYDACPNPDLAAEIAKEQEWFWTDKK